MGHEHEQHAQDLRPNSLAPRVGVVAVLNPGEDGFADAPLAVKLMVQPELTERLLPEQPAAVNISWFEERFEPALQRDLDVALPVVGRVSEQRFAFALKTLCEPSPKPRHPIVWT